MNTLPAANRLALGETLGLPVPTRYPAATHDIFNVIMAADAVITPKLLRLNWRTRTLCNGLAILLLIGRGVTASVELRRRLQIEAATGIALIGVALTQRNGLLGRLYLAIGGVLMLANALLTETA